MLLLLNAKFLVSLTILSLSSFNLSATEDVFSTFSSDFFSSTLFSVVFSFLDNSDLKAVAIFSVTFFFVFLGDNFFPSSFNSINPNLDNDIMLS